MAGSSFLLRKCCCGGDPPCSCPACPDNVGPRSATLSISGVTVSAWKTDTTTYRRIVGSPNISNMELVGCCEMGRHYFCEILDGEPDPGNLGKWDGFAFFYFDVVGGQLKLIVGAGVDIGQPITLFYGWVDVDDCLDGTYTISNVITSAPPDTTTQDLQTFTHLGLTDVYGFADATRVVSGWGGSATITIRTASSTLNSIPQPCACVPLSPGGCRSDCASAYSVSLSGVTTPSINGSTTVTRDPMGACKFADSGGTGTEVVVQYVYDIPTSTPSWTVTIVKSGATLVFTRLFADIDVCECPSGSGWTFDAAASSGYTGSPSITIS